MGPETVDTAAIPASPAVDDEPALLPGLQLGSYRIKKLLGQGGMGRVYLAEHTVIRRNVALKVLRRSLIESPRAVERFFAEARAVNSIRHPGIIEITDLFTSADTPCIVMEVLDGHTLADEIERRDQLEPARVVALGREIAAALQATHAAGIIHRDLKPENVFLVEGKGVKILDFGVAKLSEHGASTGQTNAGSIIGTPEYMAPEQLAGKPVDSRADIYSLGCTLYHALAGEPPFKGDSFGELVVKHLTVPPPSLRRAGLSASIDRAILALLAKDPEARPQTMADVDAILAGALVARRRPPAFYAGVAAAVVAVVGGAAGVRAFLAEPPPAALPEAAVSASALDTALAATPAAPAPTAEPRNEADLGIAPPASTPALPAVAKVPVPAVKKPVAKPTAATTAAAPATAAPPASTPAEPVKSAQKPTQARGVIDPFAEGG